MIHTSHKYHYQKKKKTYLKDHKMHTLKMHNMGDFFQFLFAFLSFLNISSREQMLPGEAKNTVLLTGGDHNPLCSYTKSNWETSKNFPISLSEKDFETIWMVGILDVEDGGDWSSEETNSDSDIGTVLCERRTTHTGCLLHTSYIIIDQVLSLNIHS